MQAVPPESLLAVSDSNNKPILDVCNRPIISKVCNFLHVVTILTLAGGVSIGALIFYGLIIWAPAVTMTLIIVAAVVGGMMLLSLILKCCLRYSRANKIQRLAEYTAMVEKDRSALVPNDRSKSLLDCLSMEWDLAAEFALSHSVKEVGKTQLFAGFQQLARCKFLHEKECFRKILKEDLNEEQQLQVGELTAKFENEFNQEMERLTSGNFSTRMRYSIMVDFFICQADTLIQNADELGLSTHNHPKVDVKINHLSLSGGGAKGLSFGALFRALKETMTENCRFSGASIGALGAVFKTFSLENFEEFVNAFMEYYNKTIKHNPTWETAYGWLDSKYSAWPGYFTMIGIFAFVDKRLHEKVSTFLEDCGEDAIASAFPDDPEAMKRICILKEAYDPTASREDKMVTFHDLELLRKLPNGQKTFKELSVAIWDKTDQKLLFARMDTQPNMPIVIAARASMSVPFYFTTLSIPVNGSNERPHQLVDGGIGSNSPLQAFDRVPPAEESEQGNAVMVIFDNDGWGRETTKGKPKTLPKYVRILAKFLRIAPRIDNLIAAEQDKLRQNPEKILVLPHGEINVMDFSISKADEENVDHQADMRVKAWLACRRREKLWPERLWPKV
jgi:predicted acylesterase/phospholipase RssA